VIGNKQVLEHRMRGHALPDAALYVHTDLKPSRDWQKFGERAEIAVEANDYPELLDLRFAVDLRVHVEGRDAQRVDQVAAAFVAARAARVLTTVYELSNYRAEIVRLTDTDGVMQWHR
jgi:hypothetical protein